MGRYVKNKELRSGSYSIRVPHAPGIVGPNSPVNGLIRYNDTTSKLQYFKDGAWRNIPFEGKIDLIKDTFVGDGENDIFGPMSVSYQPGEELYLFVFIGNVFQNPGVAYNVNGTNIEFTSTPNFGQPIVIIHGLGTTFVV